MRRSNLRCARNEIASLVALRWVALWIDPLAMTATGLPDRLQAVARHAATAMTIVGVHWQKLDKERFMINPKVGFIVFGVHKDGLLDPLGTPFIDDGLGAGAKQALRAVGVELVEHDIILATKQEARECLARFRPASLGQAARLAGVTPADIFALLVAAQRHPG